MARNPEIPDLGPRSGASGASGATDGAQAIRRALDVARTVAALQRSGATLSLVARSTGLKTSTTFRILRSLVEERLLSYDAAGRCYHLGPLAYELGLVAAGDVQVQARLGWRESVEHIARDTGLTTYLMARSDKEAVCLLCAQGTTVLRAMPMDVGQRVPLGIGAGSLALLASLDDAEVHRILDANAARLTMFPGGKQRAEILDRVRRTRRQGYAMSTGTVVAGVTGVGIALPAPDGGAQLALSVSAVATELDGKAVKRVAAILIEAGQQGKRTGER